MSYLSFILKLLNSIELMSKSKDECFDANLKTFEFISNLITSIQNKILNIIDNISRN